MSNRDDLEVVLAPTDRGRDVWEQAATNRMCPRCKRSYSAPPMPGVTHMLCDECMAADESARRDRERDARATRHVLVTIPPRYAWATFDAPEFAVRDPVATDRLRAASADRGIVVLGPSGVGKTTLAVCKLRQCVAQNGSLGMFVDVRRLARAARQHPLGSSSEVPLVAESIRADVLLLDDLGEERGADDAVLDVIRDRHAQDRPTIVTSGHALTMRSGIEVFGQRYGDGIARRLFQGAVVIELRLPPP